MAAGHLLKNCECLRHGNAEQARDLRGFVAVFHGGQRQEIE